MPCGWLRRASMKINAHFLEKGATSTLTCPVFGDSQEVVWVTCVKCMARGPPERARWRSLPTDSAEIPRVS